MRKIRIVIACLALLGAGLHSPTASAGSSPNARVIASIPFAGGTDLDFAGDYAYVGSYDGYGSFRPQGMGGLNVIDISDPARPLVAGRLACPGYQDDIGVWRNTVVMGMHDSGKSLDCTPFSQSGLRLVNVSDPTNPQQVSFLPIPTNGTHTLTIIGDTGYVYSNPGGLSTGTNQRTTIVDINDPAQPKIVGYFTPPHSTGCHDINVNATATRAYCAGSNVTQIWDITDPLKPVVLSEIFNPAIFFHHGAVPSQDGKTLVIADEAFAGHVCVQTNTAPTGALWFYDISNETLPVLKGFLSPSALTSTSVGGWCTAHNFNMIPGHDWLVTASYKGGTSIVDFGSMPPRVVGHVIPDSPNTWSSYYYRGHIYTGDTRRGFDVIEMDEL